MPPISFLLAIIFLSGVQAGNWERWWTYEGISGPDYWDLNPEWFFCLKGKLQSPIDLDPDTLHYDPNLDHVRIDKQTVSGKIANTGQSLVFKVDHPGQHAINISGGPLAYRYQFEEIYFHWGEPGRPGSEHTVDRQAFPAELQIFGFNAELYENMSVARNSPRGLVAVSVFVQISESLYRKSQFNHIANHLDKLVFREEMASIPNFSLFQILPDTEDYITYEGSTTYPGCWESVTWIVYNKPIYISKPQLELFYRLRQGERGLEQGPLGNNLRPQQHKSNRLVRTNIGLPAQQAGNSDCSDGMDSIEYLPNIPLSVPDPQTQPYSP